MPLWSICIEKKIPPFLTILLNFVLILVLSTACTSNQNKQRDPELAVQYPSIPFNQHLTLIRLEDMSEMPSTFVFIVKNESNETIQFPVDMRVKLFVKENKRWVEIQNNVTYLDTITKNITLSPGSNELESNGILSVIPDLRGIADPNVLRVIVVGDVLENGELTGEQVGAYIDMPIEPLQ